MCKSGTAGNAGASRSRCLPTAVTPRNVVGLGLPQWIALFFRQDYAPRISPGIGKAVYICDATVPRQRFPDVIARSRQIAASHGLDVLTLGHAGDGNLHPTVLYEPDQLATVDAIAEEIAYAALELGGTLTGEHGIGTAKRAQMRRAFGPVELAAFRAIKRAFDPDGFL